MVLIKLGDIIKRVQRQFGDDVEAQITEEDIVRWINDACLDIASANSTNQGYFIGTTPVKTGVRDYELPDDMLKLRSIRLDGGKLIGTSYEQVNEVDDHMDAAVGKPTHYWIFNKNVSLYPTPNQDYAALTIMYTKTPDIMTVAMKTIEPDIPVQYHLRLVEYCIAQAAELDDNIAHYQQKMAQFQGNILALKQNDQPDSEGVYPSITYVVED
jgi:hypothetical protein